MDDQLARFTLWALDMDVYGPLNVSLDYRLRFSPIVVKIIHQLLEVICDTLASLKPIDGPPQTPNRKRQCISEHGDSEVKRRADDDASDSDDDVDPKENSAVFSSEALQLHVAAHIKEIALLTLQKLLSGIEETATNIDSDQPLEDDEPGLAMLRGSMYSVLDDEDLDFQDDVEAPNGISGHGVERINREYLDASVTNLGVEDKDNSGMTQLHRAAQAGNLSLAESLVRTTDNHGISPLIWAVICGQLSATDDLISLGADANSTSVDGKSALAWAANLS
ncbi:hypothetical protein GGS24DRAFT_502072 [Hypoxylon argillaceum]|nr:hypothetical protein GGS24DRAFT_502072 [Hypoxylon argillaceum]